MRETRARPRPEDVTTAGAEDTAVFVPRLTGGVRSLRSLARGVAIALKSFQQFADGGVIAGGKKRQAAFLRPKNKPDGETGPAFKIVLPKPPNPQAGMKMWSSKTVANGIDGARDFAPSRSRQFPNIPPKRF